jgi:RND superfamily putative drug exporter
VFETLGHFVYRKRRSTLVLTAVFLGAAVILLVRGGTLSTGVIRDLEAERAAVLAKTVGNHPSETTFVVVFHADGLDPSGAAFRDAESSALAPLRADDRVARVLTAEDAPPPLGRGMANREAGSSFALVTLAGDVQQAQRAYPAVRAELSSDRLAITATGQVPFAHDLDRTLEHDLVRAEMISLPLALVVLLFVFRTVVAAALPVGVGALAVTGGIAAMLAISRHTDIAQYAINVCTLIGLGLAIDYSLFTVSRYREELAAGHDVPGAVARTMASAGRVVAFSGFAVATGLAGLLFFDGSYLVPMAIGGIIVVALAVLFALTFLPALLALLGPRIHAGRLPARRAESRDGGAWRRVAVTVMRRPIRALVPALVALAVMAMPFFHLRLAAADVRVLESTVEARRGHEILKRDFPDQASPRALVVAEFPDDPAAAQQRAVALRDLSRRLASLPHVARVDGPFSDAADARQPSQAPRVVLFDAVLDAPPDSDDARQVIERIRDERKIADGTLRVGGQTAKDLDETRYVAARAPRAIAFVVVTMLVTLFLLFGSVVLPVKAVLMNFASIGGSFGALVWIFQDGHLFVREPHPLEPALPVLLFCGLFGLSMDYEVLMLSRIKESYDRTGDNGRAVLDGLARSAGLITSSAAIMVAVFLAFALARVEVVRAVGVGMALAVAIDATLVRVVVVPATMRLFGRLNWWAPQALADLRRRLGFAPEHASAGEAQRPAIEG